MSLRLDSAETGRVYMPRPSLDGVANSSTGLSDITPADEAIPEDFWKPVETSACASRLPGIPNPDLMSAQANTLSSRPFSSNPVRCSRLKDEAHMTCGCGR